jgi:MFS family permease
MAENPGSITPADPVSTVASRVDAGATAGDGRPTKPLPPLQLVRLSLYWLGLTAVFAGIGGILQGRLQFEGLVPTGTEGEALFRMTVLGAVIAMLVQPTVGTISDYTTTRWGRRKPYILIGTVLDMVFLVGVASSNTVVAIAAFIVLLQVSSNFAQGPFQGYVPDLVPARQVGIASSLVGLFQVLGNVVGFGLAAAAVWLVARFDGAFFWATIALGVLELATMLSVVIRVDDGRVAKPRGSRSWASIAREAWGTDVLRERSFLFLVGSRFLVLMGGGVLINLATFYLAQSLRLDSTETGLALFGVLAVIAVGNVLAVVPAARLSDRIGRKRVIYGACFLGGSGLAVVAVAPGVPVALVGAGLFGVGSGSFLAVDWALMTDIIPKAESGRYMGISNVATASSGVVAIAIAGGLVMDRVNEALGYGAGPRAALLVGVAAFALGALVLTPVDETRREAGPAPPGDAPAPPAEALPVPAEA